MKKYLILFYLLIVANSFALDGDRFRFGFTANPGINWWKPDNQLMKSDGARFSFQYGIICDYKFGNNDRYAFGTGLTIGMSGGKLTSSTIDSVMSEVQQESRMGMIYADVTSTITGKLQYLQIPATLKLRSNQVNDFTYYGAFGLLPEFIIRRRAAIRFEDLQAMPFDGTGIVVTESDNTKLVDVPFYNGGTNVIKRVMPVNLGLQVEGGVEYSFTDNTSLVVGLFFTNGFMNVLNDDDRERVAARNFGMRIGFLF